MTSRGGSREGTAASCPLCPRGQAERQPATNAGGGQTPTQDPKALVKAAGSRRLQAQPRGPGRPQRKSRDFSQGPGGCHHLHSVRKPAQASSCTQQAPSDANLVCIRTPIPSPGSPAASEPSTCPFMGRRGAPALCEPLPLAEQIHTEAPSTSCLAGWTNGPSQLARQTDRQEAAWAPRAVPGVCTPQTPTRDRPWLVQDLRPPCTLPWPGIQVIVTGILVIHSAERVRGLFFF